MFFIPFLPPRGAHRRLVHYLGVSVWDPILDLILRIWRSFRGCLLAVPFSGETYYHLAKKKKEGTKSEEASCFLGQKQKPVLAWNGKRANFLELPNMMKRFDNIRKLQNMSQHVKQGDKQSFKTCLQRLVPFDSICIRICRCAKQLHKC